MIAPIKAIYFDLDDTLCGYWDASKAALRSTFDEFRPGDQGADACIGAWATAFRSFSPEVKSTEWYQTYLRFGGKTRNEQMARTLQVLGVDDSTLAVKLGDRYGELRNANLALFDDAIEVLDNLYHRFPLGLITNGPADIQRQEIATLGIGHYFQHFYIEGEVGFGKPEPEVFRRAAYAVGCLPEDCLMVGNSYGHDVRPALACGWQSIWIRRPSDVAPSADGSSKPEERPPDSPEPTAVIGSLRELLDLLPA
ncbi:MAG: HAD family hydrolase [Chthonomonas sp.]|nr:HAD family hydrolase [Chthonomonas sp.]